MLRLNGYSTAAFGKSHETAAWEVSPSGPTDRWPTRSGFDKFYGFIGGETNQWAPLLYDGMTQVEPSTDPNYHFMTDMTNQAIDWMQVPEVAHAGQAVLHLLRAGRHACAAPCAEGVDRQVQGQVRPGLGQAARGDAGAAEEAGRRAGGDEARAQARGHQGLGCADAGREEALRPPDGGVRRVRRVRRHGDRPADPGHRGDRPARQHAGLLHRRRQRRERRRRHERALQRDDLLQRRERDRPGHPQALRRAWRPGDLSALRRRLGGRGRHALHVDEAGRLQLRRHAQRHGDPLAEGHHGEGRDALAVAPCHRHRADDPGGGRPARAEERERHAADRRSKA